MLKIAVSLGLQHRAALAAFVERASDRDSTASGHYITPAQFASLYGPSSDAVQQVSDYLRGRGLAVTSVSANRTLIDATGAVSAIEAAFGVTISDWHDPQLNRDFYGNATQPSLPSSIAPLVVGVIGLDNHYPLRRIGAARPASSPGPNGGYTPLQLKTAYDVNPLAATGHDGSGQALGLFELNDFKQANIDMYDTNYYGHTLSPVGVVLVDGSTGTPNSEIEVELDIEVMHAFAPGATVTVWEGPNSNQGAIDTYNAMVNSNTTPVNSTSWGDCEPQVMAGNMLALDNIFIQAAAQGQTFFASSGDYGPYDCNQNQPTNCTTAPPMTPNCLAVDYPASDPYITGVGGTTLTLNANDTYQSESAWFAGTATWGAPLGSGGGVSSFFAMPTWQTGPGVNKAGISNGMRQVPDVALHSNPNPGYSVYTTVGASPGWTKVGGTSAAAPSWAAMAAIYNQFAAVPQTRGGRLGFANPSIYALESSSPSPAPFHDITTGTNPYANYSPTANWDFSTGWGTPDAGILIPELLAENFTVRSWVPTAANANTGVSPPPVPRGRWYGVPRQHGLALNSFATARTPTLPQRGRETAVGSVQGWMSWFAPQAIDRLKRLFS